MKYSSVPRRPPIIDEEIHRAVGSGKDVIADGMQSIEQVGISPDGAELGVDPTPQGQNAPWSGTHDVDAGNQNQHLGQSGLLKLVS